MRVLIIFFYLVLGLFILATLIHITASNTPERAHFEEKTKSYMVSVTSYKISVCLS